MKKLTIALSLLLALSFTACTDNYWAKKAGGTMEVVLPANKKLVNATWKDTELWYLIQDRKEGEAPQTTEFKEQSQFGVLQGTVIFREQ